MGMGLGFTSHLFGHALQVLELEALCRMSLLQVLVVSRQTTVGRNRIEANKDDGVSYSCL